MNRLGTNYIENDDNGLSLVRFMHFKLGDNNLHSRYKIKKNMRSIVVYTPLSKTWI